MSTLSRSHQLKQIAQARAHSLAEPETASLPSSIPCALYANLDHNHLILRSNHDPLSSSSSIRQFHLPSTYDRRMTDVYCHSCSPSPPTFNTDDTSSSSRIHPFPIELSLKPEDFVVLRCFFPRSCFSADHCLRLHLRLITLTLLSILNNVWSLFSDADLNSKLVADQTSSI